MKIKNEKGLSLLSLVIIILIVILLILLFVRIFLSLHSIVNTLSNNHEKIDTSILADEQITASTIADTSDKSLYYGKIVNYEPNESLSENIKWKIFYADNDNIYLIASDYILAEDAPTINGISAAKTEADAHSLGYYYTKYLVDSSNFSEIYTEGSSWIRENSKAANWLSLLYNSTLTSSNLSNEAETTEEWLNEIAYLLDTTIWTGKFGGTGAEYVIGGPTLDLFCASYNQTHSTTIDYTVSSDFCVGYIYKWSSNANYEAGLSGIDSYNDLYVINSGEKATAMSISSLSASRKLLDR